ncbi:winged helix-turn-helix transcriptional regulator [Streptomyces sp. NPDC060275]|uniref:winged helix-turn-helix transcriptional regulator n=1 Tax=Streptomyces sp. NPDC060275 TaxID=3347090 RepID=UPI00364AB1E9
MSEAVARHTSFAEMQCPIARALDQAGEWWSLLILRDAFQGSSRFGEFQKGLGISDNSLTRRLSDLVGKGLLERRAYQERPKRYEYVLTDAGRDFLPVLVSLAQWGKKYDRPEQGETWVADAQTGRMMLPVFVDRCTGEEISGHGVVIVNTAAGIQTARPQVDEMATPSSSTECSHPKEAS